MKIQSMTKTKHWSNYSHSLAESPFCQAQDDHQDTCESQDNFDLKTEPEGEEHHKREHLLLSIAKGEDASNLQYYQIS